MEGQKDEVSSSYFPTEETPQEKGRSHVPERFKVPLSHRPNTDSEIAYVPVVDLAGLKEGSEQRSFVVKDIGNACRSSGLFQVINHGIEQRVLDGALSAAFGFFNLPNEEKLKLKSDDVHMPVRYGTSLGDGVDLVKYWRIFLKHYANPLHHWIQQWPDDPPDYREKMGKYVVEVKKLAMEMMGAITEGLGIGPTYLRDKMEEGVQVMAVNCYPPCPQPGLALGLPPHSDYSCLSVVLQTSHGLQILDTEYGTWRAVPFLHGSLQVHVGDHLEVLSNGMYKSVVHRVILNHDMTRVSIASLHSLGRDEKMDTAKELVDEQHPKGYKDSSFKDFLEFLSKNDIAEGKSFVNTLRIERIPFC